MAKITFNPLTTTWTPPATFPNAVIEAWGAGGGASGANLAVGGAGGGGGAYVKSTLTINQGAPVTINVGLGGTGNSSGGTGGDSGLNVGPTSFGTNPVADYGRGGAVNTTGSSSLGGKAVNSTGDIIFEGGDGYVPLAVIMDGGGGGGAAGVAGTGNNASGETHGSGGDTPAGDGGDGGDNTAVTDGTNGTFPGGGGGGEPVNNITRTSGAGANGLLTISYTEADVTVSDTIVFTESLFTQNPRQDTLDLQERATATVVRSASVSDTIVLSDAPVRGYPRSLSDLLILVEVLKGGRQFSFSVTDVIALSEIALKFQPQLVHDILHLTETLTGSNTGKIVRDILTLVESVSFAGTTTNHNVTDTINLTENLLGYIFDVCKDKFSPSPSLGISSVTTLSYPYVSPTYEVSLRNPKFNNNQSQNNNTLIRTSQGGDQIVVSDTDWITITILNLEFEQLDSDQATALLVLLEASAADDIKLLDWENRTWRGRIILSEIPVLVRHDDGCSYDATLKFEGALQ